MKEPDKKKSEKWFNDKKNWKAGIFYFNPADKRIFPPKRFGIGWTINFGNPVSIAVFIALIILSIVTTYLFNR